MTRCLALLDPIAQRPMVTAIPVLAVMILLGLLALYAASKLGRFVLKLMLRLIAFALIAASLWWFCLR